MVLPDRRYLGESASCDRHAVVHDKPVAPRLRAALLLLCIAASLVLVTAMGVPHVSQVREWLDYGSTWTPLAAVAGTAALAVVMVPRTAVAAMAGIVFGPLVGAAYALLGALIAAAIGFTLGRGLGRGYVRQLMAKPKTISRRLGILEAHLTRNGLLTVALARFLPLMPFGLLNYLFGTMKLTPTSFLAGTALGIAPTTVAYAMLGAAAADSFATGLIAAVAFGTASIVFTSVLNKWLRGVNESQSGVSQGPRGRPARQLREAVRYRAEKVGSQRSP